MFKDEADDMLTEKSDKKADSADKIPIKSDKEADSADKMPIKSDKRAIKSDKKADSADKSAEKSDKSAVIDLEEREKIIIKFIDENGSITNLQACQLLNLRSSSVKNIFKRMVEKSLIEPVGKYKGRKYIIKG